MKNNKLAVTQNVLLVTDFDQAESELTSLLSSASFGSCDIFVKQLESFSSKENIILPQKSQYDVAIVWLEDKKKLNTPLLSSLKNCVTALFPSIIITNFKVPSKHSVNLTKQFAEHFYQPDLTSSLLGRTLSSLYFENKYMDSLGNDIQDQENTKAILDVVSEGVIICDVSGNIQTVNPVAEKIFSASEDELFGTSFIALLDEGYGKDVDTYFKKEPGSSKFVFIKEVEGVRKTGEVFPLDLVISCAQLSGGNFYTCTVTDVTMRKMRDQEFHLAATIFESHTAILITDNSGTILRINRSFTRITGYTADEVIGKNPRMLQSGHQSKEFYEKFWATIKETGKWEGEIWNKRKDGEIYPEFQTITAVKNGKGETTHYVATFQDITERKQTQALIEHQAFYDALTNLPNRRLMLDRLNQELSAARRHNFYGALLFLDLDHFKTLNDSMGHAVGDMLLQQVAERLTGSVRQEDTVARLGGDEFVVLLANLGDNETHAGNLANNIASKIHASLVEPYSLQGSTLNFTSSIGITLFPFVDESADDVLKHADSAMYRAKNMGRDSICFYKPSMQAEADRRLQIEKDLRVAIDNQEMALYYQPQFSHNGVVVGVEALLRWVHPRDGLTLPNEFIGLAEEVNLIQQLGDWVLETAIMQYMRWKNSGIFRSDEYVAVNVSPKQLQQDSFVNTVERLLRLHEMPSKSLKLELTESVLLHDLEDMTEKMLQLKELGVSFSMDDFGTGFSSLSYLKRLPFDQIKIDKTFVRDVSQSMNDAAIVETIIAMAEHLNLDVIAEGVETKEEVDFLNEKGCSSYQGFYFSTPLPASSLESFLQDWVQKNSGKIINLK